MMVTSIPRWPTSAPDVYLNTRKLANKNGKTPTFTDEQMYFDKFSNLPPEIQTRSRLVNETRPMYSSFGGSQMLDHTHSLPEAWGQTSFGQRANKVHCRLFPGRACENQKPLSGSLPKQMVGHRGGQQGSAYFTMLRGQAVEKPDRRSNFIPDPRPQPPATERRRNSRNSFRPGSTRSISWSPVTNSSQALGSIPSTSRRPSTTDRVSQPWASIMSDKPTPVRPTPVRFPASPRVVRTAGWQRIDANGCVVGTPRSLTAR